MFSIINPATVKVSLLLCLAQERLKQLRENAVDAAALSEQPFNDSSFLELYDAIEDARNTCGGMTLPDLVKASEPFAAAQASKWRKFCTFIETIVNP